MKQLQIELNIPASNCSLQLVLDQWNSWVTKIHSIIGLICIFAESSEPLSNSEIKCPSCKKWTPGDQANCIHCGALVDPTVIDRKEREDRADKIRQEREAAETRFEKYLKKLQQSKNPFTRFLYGVLNIIWIIYMALVTFVIWFTAIFSG